MITVSRPDQVSVDDCLCVFTGLKSIKYYIPGMLQTFQWDKETYLEDYYPPMTLCFGIDGNLIPCLILSHAFKRNNFTKIHPIPQYVAPAPQPKP